MTDQKWDKLLELLDAQYELFRTNFPESNELDVYEDVRFELVEELNKIKESEPADSITKKVVGKLAARSHKGVRAYGQSCDREDLSEIEWLQHLHEEILDSSVYCQKLIEMKLHDNAKQEERVNELKNRISYLEGRLAEKGIE